MSTMLKTKLYTIVVGCCVFIIVFGIRSFVPSFPNQWTYSSKPIAKRPSERNTSFSPGLSLNPNCSLSGYILVHRYAGQQGGGVKSLVSLQRWVKGVGLPMMIVEPFIQDSFLGIYRESFPDFKFSDMFDLEKFNRVSHSDGIAELIPWEAYANNCAFFHAVLVRIHQTSASVPPNVVWNARPGSSDCWPHGDKRRVIAIHKGPLCYVRVVDYYHNSSNILSSREVCDIVFAGLELDAVNLVFTMWSMTWHSPDAYPRPVSSYLHSYSTSYAKNGSVYLSDNLQDSPQILLDVKNYQKQFLSDGSSYVAVMLRIEYVISNQKRVEGSLNFTELQDILDKTVNVTTTVMGELRMKDVFVTADIGLYGSITWRGTLNTKRFHNGERARVEERIKCTVEKLYKNKWAFEEWEKSFAQATGGVKERGYIAALQRGIASRASCMILVGGGAFQTLTLRNYIALTESHKRCIHFVSAKQKSSDVKKLYALKNT